jgi:hypothetical protein
MSGSTQVTSAISQVPGGQQPMSIESPIVPKPAMLFSWLRSVGTYGFSKLITFTRRQARLHFISPLPDRTTLWHYQYPTYLPARAWKRHSAYLLYRKEKARS